MTGMEVQMISALTVSSNIQFSLWIIGEHKAEAIYKLILFWNKTAWPK